MKRAFTLLELAAVLVVLGIVLSVARFYPTRDRDLSYAAKQILNDLAYTRGLSLMQGAFRSQSVAVASKDEWFKARWQVYFVRSKSATNNEQTYTIFLDKNGDGNANVGKSALNLDREIAVDILSPTKLMNSGQSGVIGKDDERASKRFNVEQSYGVSSVEFRGACAGSTRATFDELGRLHSPMRTALNPYEKLLFHKTTPCIIRLSNAQKQSLCILIEPLSGLASVPKFNANSQKLDFKGKKVECREI